MALPPEPVRRRLALMNDQSIDDGPEHNTTHGYMLVLMPVAAER